MDRRPRRCVGLPSAGLVDELRLRCRPCAGWPCGSERNAPASTVDRSPVGLVQIASSRRRAALVASDGLPASGLGGLPSAGQVFGSPQVPALRLVLLSIGAQRAGLDGGSVAGLLQLASGWRRHDGAGGLPVVQAFARFEQSVCRAEVRFCTGHIVRLNIGFGGSWCVRQGRWAVNSGQKWRPCPTLVFCKCGGGSMINSGLKEMR
jgi:hypothetical protein